MLQLVGAQSDPVGKPGAVACLRARLHFRASVEASPTGAFYAHLVWKRLE
jgi:hypothetical protein